MSFWYMFFFCSLKKMNVLYFVSIETLYIVSTLITFDRQNNRKKNLFYFISILTTPKENFFWYAIQRQTVQ